MAYELEKILEKIQKFNLDRDNKIQKDSLDRDNELSKLIASVIRQQQLLGQISTLQHQKEILAHIYEKALSYTNLVMLGGYAGIFGTWQLMKNNLSSNQESLVACLIISSIMLFAGFELFKMISQAFFIRRLDKILSKNFPENEQISAWQIGFKEYEIKQARIWLYFLIPTVLTGFGAGFILLWIFLTGK